MAVITPDTDLYLLKVPLEINDMNQLTFANKQAQFNYFNSLPKLEAENFTYQRQDGTIRFSGNYDELISYNYCMYRNTAFSDKWFYAFITGMEWKSPNSTDIAIKTDCWQTYQFDLTFKPVLVAREHTNDDTIGANILEEGLELGEMTTNGTVTNFNSASDYCIVVEVSQLENEGESSTLSYEWDDGSTTRTTTPSLNDINRGTTPLIAGLTIGENIGVNLSEIREIYDFAGLSDSIINVYMIPQSLVGTTHSISLHAQRSGGSALTVLHIPVPDRKDGVYNLGTYTVTRPSSVDGYIPKNNKVYTYPFCYFNLSNNSGTSLPYRYEDFSENSIQFKIEGTFGVSGNTKAIPLNYKNISSSENALDYSVSGAKYPVCSWKSDSYTNWLTQNAVNLETQWKTGLLHAGANFLTGGFSGLSAYKEAKNLGGGLGLGTALTMGAGGSLIGSGADLIALAREQHLAKTQANMVSDQVHGNLNAGDIVWAKYKSPFTVMPMSVKAPLARCIDDYFSQFGYQTNRIKLPNITGRRNWNYVKTTGCYIEADIPQSDLAEIKNMFDNGVTFWHNPATFADYSQNNDII